MNAYREKDLRPVVEELQEKLAEREEELAEARALVPKRRALLGSVHRAVASSLETLAPKAGLALLILFGVGVLGWVIYCIATLPSHRHVSWQGQPALENSCRNNEAADCHAEARAECQDDYANLNLVSTYHPEHTEYEPYTTIGFDGNPTTQWHYVRYDAYTDYVLTYRCKVGNE